MDNAEDEKNWRDGSGDDGNWKGGSDYFMIRKGKNDDFGFGSRGHSREMSWRRRDSASSSVSKDDERNWRTGDNAKGAPMNIRRRCRSPSSASAEFENSWRHAERRTSRPDIRGSNFGHGGDKQGGNTSSRSHGYEGQRQQHNHGQPMPANNNAPVIERSLGRDRRHQGPVFGFKKLFNYLEMDPNDVLVSINSDKEEWKNLLESSELNGDKLLVAIQVIGEKICVDTDEVALLPQLQATALNACCSAIVTAKMEEIVSKMMCNVPLSSKRNPNSKSDFEVDCNPEKVLKNLYELCHLIMKIMPNNGIDYFQGLIAKSVGCLAVKDFSSGLMDKFKSLADQISAQTETKHKSKEIRRQSTFDVSNLAHFDSELPPDHIQDIPTIPTVEELRQTYGAYLRPNKPAGAYNDCDHYLDVQFRLLREDFVKPLRKGVQTFLKNKDDYVTGIKRMPLGEGRLYTNVTILGVKKARETTVYLLQLPESCYKRVKWDKSKRLLTGSLIVLTTVGNCFQPGHTSFGVVFSRDLTDLQKGVVSISWESSPPTYVKGEEYLLFESEVYLVAYRHTLDTLKRLDLGKFPMKKFIVDACNDVDEPDYLLWAEQPLHLKLADGSTVNVTHDDLSTWPSAEAFGLDENQYLAFRAAVTQEFSVTQGPPGTGKTFVGVKVVETLLDNSALWKRKGAVGGPITVVCYTNHALDQFLEEILKYYEREKKNPAIIRIGGRCKSEVLTKFTLSEVRQRNRRNKDFPRFYWESQIRARERVENLERKRSTQMGEITELQNLRGIIDFKALSVWPTLQKEFPEKMWNCLENPDWLGIGNERTNVLTFSKHEMVKDMFKLHEFPRRVDENIFQRIADKAKEVQVKRIALPSTDPLKIPNDKNQEEGEDANEEEEEEDEECDLEEVMENRVDDEHGANLQGILLEAVSSKSWNAYGFERLSYTTGYSVSNCSRQILQLKTAIENFKKPPPKKLAHPLRQSEIRSKSKGLVEPTSLWQNLATTPELALTLLENRKKLLTEIFRLHNEQYLDLPDVKELLKAVKATGNSEFDFNKLRIDERWALYFAVAERARILAVENVAELDKGLHEAQRELRNILDLRDGLLVRDCDVMGLTTTGAAKYNNLIKMIGSRIVVVEEAAEVFEAHIVTCISKYCEQLILIGDHRQLRPSPTVYELAKKYNLDLSLFERMLNNNLHCYQLKLQHRMRPDISDLVVGTIYEELHNHERVQQYPNVKGLVKNVFFITHNEKEKSESDSTSKSNEHEANFIAGLCTHLILQGYQPERITVLTMYTGQMSVLRRKVQAVENCKGIRITCVDNFQGEENDIILLSLVRSNDEGKIGFLNIDNRICVSVSRAKHGLYIIGNMDMMEGKSKTWKAIKQKLEDKEQIGDALELECENHPEMKSKVQVGEDFRRLAPAGGCLKMCDATLSCSHKCPRICHVVDKDHVEFKCRMPCLKLCANDIHPCAGMCFQKCPSCFVPVERTLPCEYEHKKIMRCWQKVEDAVCEEIVEKELPCGHTETLACHIKVESYKCQIPVLRKLIPCGCEKTLKCYEDPASIRCKAMVPKTLPCGHTQNYECWREAKDLKCDTMVPKKLSCDHEVQVKCFEKDKKTICFEKCTIRLDCGHKCRMWCHTQDDPDHIRYECKKPCAKECADNHPCKFNHQCYQPCPPCKDLIKRNLPCGHEKTLMCSVDITAYKCLDKCQRQLPCGHACPNKCSDACGPCKTLVKRLADCGHEQMVTCGEAALKENCEVFVHPKTVPSCGHTDILVPCKVDGASEEDLSIYCNKPCDYVFTPPEEGEKGCDHKCSGTCLECFQGRIHKKCGAICDKPLVCGHRCEVKCSAYCPPCQKPCVMKCEHTKCKRKCGEPCTPCKEKCKWSCPHARCTKKCGEICDRQPCNEPCPKKLQCSHDCVGFCGEPCPPLCRICNKKELVETVEAFLFDYEDDSRFVYLPDCGHTIEAGILENYLNATEDNEVVTQITAKVCPFMKKDKSICSTPIRNCRRFHKIILKYLNDVNAVKMRSFGNQGSSNKMRNEWIQKLGLDGKSAIASMSVLQAFPDLHAKLGNKLVCQGRDQKGQLKVVPLVIDECSMRSLEFIAKSATNVASNLLELKKEEMLTDSLYKWVVQCYLEMFNFMYDRHPLSHQEVQDFNRELDRVDFLKQLMMRYSMPACEAQRPFQIYLKAKKYLASSKPLDSSRREAFLALLKELDECLKSGLGITNRERHQILKAMGMSQGKWFKCPNGHIYLIGDCGGAMQQSVCNECQSAIGGENHQLRGDNSLASEMDGAQTPAWPTALQR